MKCWAMAYLKDFFAPAALQKAVEAAGQSLAAFIKEYTQAIPLTMNLCNEVLANCFVNATYDPSRNGTCPTKVLEFKAGFEYQNVRNLEAIRFPFNS